LAIGAVNRTQKIIRFGLTRSIRYGLIASIIPDGGVMPTQFTARLLAGTLIFAHSFCLASLWLAEYSAPALRGLLP
jgi:hypothetical protein